MSVVGGTAIDWSRKTVRNTQLVCSRPGLRCVILFPSFRNPVVMAGARDKAGSSFRGGALFSPRLSFCFCRGDIPRATGLLFRSAGSQTTKCNFCWLKSLSLVIVTVGYFRFRGLYASRRRAGRLLFELHRRIVPLRAIR